MAAWPENVPASHRAQESADVADDILEYFPESQLIQSLGFSGEYWPGVQIARESGVISIRSKQIIFRLSEMLMKKILMTQNSAQMLSTK